MMTRSTGGWRGRVGALCGAALLSACITETPEQPTALDEVQYWVEGQKGLREVAPTRGAGQAAGPRAVEPGAPEPTVPGSVVPGAPAQDGSVVTDASPSSPYERFDWNLIRNPDGSLTKIYYLRTTPGCEVYVRLMQRFIPGFAALRHEVDYRMMPDYLLDPRKKNLAQWHEGSAQGVSYGTGEVADLLVVTSTEEMLRQIDSFLSGLISELPQVELEVTIVEITMDDATTWGIQTSLTRGTADDPENNLFDSVVVDLAQNLVEGTFGSFSAIQDESVINGLVEFLQTNTTSNVLSSPKLAVLNGHRAVIDTGSEIPFFTPRFSANGIQSISTSFKPTGIRVVAQPFILSEDVVQLELDIEVSSVTGFVTAGVGSGAEVDNPLIARRNAYTVVNVPSGASVLIGGLVTTDEVLNVDKVPLLGDIPWLGKLFRKETTSEQRAQVLFLVRPRIIYEEFTPDVFYDPGDELRDWGIDPGN